MYYYFLSGLALVSSFLFFKLDTPSIISTTLIDRYQGWKSLNALVATQQSSKITVIAISISMILEALYVSFSAYLHNNVRQVSRDTYEVSYVIRGRLYKMQITPIRGPSPVIAITNQNGEDVSHKILPYYGPRYDWHNRFFTPSDFDEEELTFDLKDGPLVFETEQPIQI